MSGAYVGTPRSYVADALRAALPDWDIKARPMTPENIPRDRPIASVWRHAVAPGAGVLNLDHEVTVNVYVSRTSTDALEEELEGELDALLSALHPLPRVTWKTADRATWREGTITGWRVTVTVNTPNYYRTTRTTEETTP